MSRAILVLAVLAVLCVLASASPAKEMEKMLNTVQDGLYSSPLQEALENADMKSQQQLADAIDAHKSGAVMDLDAEEHSFAQQSAEAGVESKVSVMASKFGVHSKPARAVNGRSLKSLSLTTGLGGQFNSHCFACQYYVQRTLGALLGPFYNPNAAGAPAPAYNAPVGYIDTAVPKVAWTRPTSVSSAAVTMGPASKAPARKLILAEVDSQVEDVSFLEISSFVKEAFPTPSAEEALEQYAKWEPYLSMIEVDAEDMAEVDDAEEADADTEKKTKKSKKAKKNVKKALKTMKTAHKKLMRSARRVIGDSSSVSAKHGPMYGKKDLAAARTFFANLCHRRTPAEFMPVCRGLWKKLPQVLEELSVGDRPDEICVRQRFCSESSYLVKRAHSVVRPSD